MALHHAIQSTVDNQARDAEDEITAIDLPVIKSLLRALVYVAVDQLGGTANAAALFVAIRQIYPSSVRPSSKVQRSLTTKVAWPRLTFVIMNSIIVNCR